MREKKRHPRPWWRTARQHLRRLGQRFDQAVDRFMAAHIPEAYTNYPCRHCSYSNREENSAGGSGMTWVVHATDEECPQTAERWCLNCNRFVELYAGRTICCNSRNWHPSVRRADGRERQESVKLNQESL